MDYEYKLGDIAKMKKQHPCGSDEWEIVRLGADIKLKCTGCEHVVMLERKKFEKNLKKILTVGDTPSNKPDNGK